MAIEQKIRNCFVSYHHDRDQKYISKLRRVIAQMKVADYSLKEDIGHLTDETIYKKVRERMRSCSVIVVLIGERTGHRKWIDWEKMNGATVSQIDLMFHLVKGRESLFSAIITQAGIVCS